MIMLLSSSFYTSMIAFSLVLGVRTAITLPLYAVFNRLCRKSNKPIIYSFFIVSKISFTVCSVYYWKFSSLNAFYWTFFYIRMMSWYLDYIMCSIDSSQSYRDMLNKSEELKCFVGIFCYNTTIWKAFLIKSWVFFRLHLINWNVKLLLSMIINIHFLLLGLLCIFILHTMCIIDNVYLPLIHSQTWRLNSCNRCLIDEYDSPCLVFWLRLLYPGITFFNTLLGRRIKITATNITKSAKFDSLLENNWKNLCRYFLINISKITQFQSSNLITIPYYTGGLAYLSPKTQSRTVLLTLLKWRRLDEHAPSNLIHEGKRSPLNLEGWVGALMCSFPSRFLNLFSIYLLSLIIILKIPL